MPTPVRDIAVLLSGGVDSAVCAALAKRSGRLKACFVVDYNQPARVQELTAAQAFADHIEVELHELQLSIGNLHEMDAGIGAEGPRVIPGRNAAMLTAVACHCVQVGFREIWFGAIADDQAEYEDCRPEFIESINAAMSRSMPFPVKVSAPLIGKWKPEVMAMARELGIDVGALWSCYQPTDDGDPCHTCNSCLNRKAACER